MLGRIGTLAKGANLQGNSLGNQLRRKDILSPFRMFYSLVRWYLSVSAYNLACAGVWAICARGGYTTFENLAGQEKFYNLRYPNNTSTAMRHPGTAGSASAISPRRKITGFSGSLAL